MPTLLDLICVRAARRSSAQACYHASARGCLLTLLYELGPHAIWLVHCASCPVLTRRARASAGVSTLRGPTRGFPARARASASRRRSRPASTARTRTASSSSSTTRRRPRHRAAMPLATLPSAQREATQTRRCSSSGARCLPSAARRSRVRRTARSVRPARHASSASVSRYKRRQRLAWCDTRSASPCAREHRLDNPSSAASTLCGAFGMPPMPRRRVHRPQPLRRRRRRDAPRRPVPVATNSVHHRQGPRAQAARERRQAGVPCERAAQRGPGRAAREGGRWGPLHVAPLLAAAGCAQGPRSL
jgi:hypothetical protein